MNFLSFALQSAPWLGWIVGHWIGVVAALAFLGIVYFVAALALNLPLPFEEKPKE